MTTRFLPPVPLALLLLLAVAGCSVTHREYDVSSLQPFAAYTGKDVALTRDAVLIVLTTEPTIKPADLDHCIIGYPDELGMSSAVSTYPHISLKRGTIVHVEFTRLYSEDHGLLHNFFHFANLKSGVRVRLPVEGGAAFVAVAGFDHSANQSASVGFGSFRGRLRPAPWEPPDTPPERTFDWPDDQHLRKHQRDSGFGQK